jgi:hypothetical protein
MAWRESIQEDIYAVLAGHLVARTHATLEDVFVLYPKEEV